MGVATLSGVAAPMSVHTSESEVCVVVSRDVVSVSVRDCHVTHVSDDPDCGKCDPVPSNVVEPPGLVDAVVAGIEAAVWSGTDSDGGRSLSEAGYDAGDVAAVAVDALAGDLAEFWHAHAGDLAGIDPAQIGHDFVLTRNGHGAGFWDRGLGDRGDRLTAACKPYGEWDLYPGDDGLLYS